MEAELLLKDRIVQSERCFAELVVWRLPETLPGSRHNIKYRLALVFEGVCVLRYDNEAGKGDHKHVGDRETGYVFKSPEQLLADFWRDVDQWRSSHEESNLGS
ncbi:MAG: DUF6516 family protein [Methylomonas sp.]|jgi:hypothetical protein